jgi:hypothetical protein
MNRQIRRILKVYVRLGWLKLHDYYEKLTSVAYAGVQAINPFRSFHSLSNYGNRSLILWLQAIMMTVKRGFKTFGNMIISKESLTAGDLLMCPTAIAIPNPSA